MAEMSTLPAGNVYPGDAVAIYQLLALYGRLVDERDWDGLAELFTEDPVFNASGFGSPIHYGWISLRRAWEASDDNRWPITPLTRKSFHP